MVNIFTHVLNVILDNMVNICSQIKKCHHDKTYYQMLPKYLENGDHDLCMIFNVKNSLPYSAYKPLHNI